MILTEIDIKDLRIQFLSRLRTKAYVTQIGVVDVLTKLVCRGFGRLRLLDAMRAVDVWENPYYLGEIADSRMEALNWIATDNSSLIGDFATVQQVLDFLRSEE